ncbi:hypothetical protein ACFLV7_14590 [Chloroflexota bacterium]
MNWRISLRIHIQRRSDLTVLLTLAILTIIFFGYLVFAQESAAASNQQASVIAYTRMRQYYLTKEPFKGSKPGGSNGSSAGVCANGYHFASLWEILDPSNLKYDTILGDDHRDSGKGPPSFTLGWVRTGYSSNNSHNPGLANCSSWELESGFGTVVSLTTNWTDSSNRDIFVWDAALHPCSQEVQVWCIEDHHWMKIYYPLIMR